MSAVDTIADQRSAVETEGEYFEFAVALLGDAPADLTVDHIAETPPSCQEVCELQRESVGLLERLPPVGHFGRTAANQPTVNRFGGMFVQAHCDCGAFHQTAKGRQVFGSGGGHEEHSRHGSGFGSAGAPSLRNQPVPAESTKNPTGTSGDTQ